MESKNIRVPAEFEIQEALWLSWTTRLYKKEYSIQELQMKIIKEVSPTQKVRVICEDESSKISFENMIESEEISKENIEAYIIPFKEIWLRDNGPTFFLNENSELGISHFKFNFWGYLSSNSQKSKEESKISKTISKYLEISHNIDSPIVSEGGGREVNGIGDMLVIEALEKERNPTMSKKELEEEYSRTLGVKNIIWIPYASIYDDKEYVKHDFVLNGHIDGFARFVSEDTIVYVPPEIYKTTDEKELEEMRRMVENENALKEARSINGNPFKLIKMPGNLRVKEKLVWDDPLYHMTRINNFQEKKGPVKNEKYKNEDYTFSYYTNYVNFVITNKVIIESSYWMPGMPKQIKKADETAEKILKRLFPDRKIVMINSRAINVADGGIHCITNNQPLSSSK